MTFKKFILLFHGCFRVFICLFNNESSIIIPSLFILSKIKYFMSYYYQILSCFVLNHYFIQTTYFFQNCIAHAQLYILCLEFNDYVITRTTQDTGMHLNNETFSSRHFAPHNYNHGTCHLMSTKGRGPFGTTRCCIH